MKELRCLVCNRLLIKYEIPAGIAEAKCERCNKVNRFTFGLMVQVTQSDWNGLGTKTAMPKEAQARVSENPVSMTK